MGIAFTLAGREPRDRTPPHTIYRGDYFSSAGGAGHSGDAQDMMVTCAHRPIEVDAPAPETSQLESPCRP